MARNMLLEICVESIEHAVAAEQGGADRIELCTALSCGGVTPSAALMEGVRKLVRNPIHALIRPRAGDFCYNESEFETIRHEIDMAKQIGLDGIVVGVLDESSHVDRERTRDVVQCARPLPVTFHRAFDQCPDLNAALEAAIETGAKRILTAGGRDRVMDGLGNVADLIVSARERIVVMPGGGVRPGNVGHILRTTGASEIHSSLGASDLKPAQFEAEVCKFKRAVEALSSDPSYPG